MPRKKVYKFEGLAIYHHGIDSVLVPFGEGCLSMDGLKYKHLTGRKIRITVEVVDS